MSSPLAFAFLIVLLALASVVFDFARLAGLLEGAVAVVRGSVECDDVVIIGLIEV